MRPRFPLLMKIAVVLLLAVAVPMAALAGMSFYLLQTIRADTDQKVETTLDLAMNLEESLVGERLQAMEHVAAAVANDRAVVASTSRPENKPDLVRFTRFYPTADMLVVVDRAGTVLGRATSDVIGDRIQLGGLIQQAMDADAAMAYPALIGPNELKGEGDLVREQVVMPILTTKNSTDSRAGSDLDTALALVGVFPVHGPDGAVTGAVIAADILNRDFSIVDQVAHRAPAGVPIFATIALDGIRVTTNVRLTDQEGNPSQQRALGTIYADEVVAALRGGTEYRGRAPVVGQWQRTIYRPLRDYAGNVVAGPYVGVPEAYFTTILSNVSRSIRLVMSVVAAALAALVLIALWWTYRRVIRPIRRMDQQIRARGILAAAASRPKDEVGGLTDSLGGLMQYLESTAGALEELALEVEGAAGSLHEAMSHAAGDADRALAAADGSLAVSRELQQGAGQTAVRLNQLSEAVVDLTEGCRRQERSVRYTGKVATEIAGALADSKERVDRAIAGTTRLVDAARACLKRVAELTAGMAILQKNAEGTGAGEAAAGLFRDPTDVLTGVATTAERIAAEVRVLVLTIQENQARLKFINEEMGRVGGVVEATADRTQQAGQAAQAVADWVERMAASSHWIEETAEATHASVEAIASAYGGLQELAARVRERAGELRQAAGRLK